MFVASFIGSPSMNFIEGQLSENGQQFIAQDGTSIVVDQAPLAAYNRSVVLGIRPEHIVVAPHATTEAKVVVTEPTGSETHVVATVAGKNITCVLRERMNLEVGQTFKFTCSGANMHFFDPQTTLRIG
jgi:multiple sugar transport system ATP-binding protein